ncbi:Extracellular solute-binding protein, family 3 [Artemisia annua]|uniref:Extracellular solute-binding protein, family 3 n=1 Tax=Artemisia annua TaxID=35608 RepID=A0A2U1LLS6_ARTAN|nr:Extracellular solute-binding protein, family 3 [Artemisia annua]
MEHQVRVVSCKLVFMLICICCIVVSVDASSLTSSFKRRSIQAQQPVDVCAGAKWNVKKQGKSPCPTLTAWVPKRRGFSEFVNVNEYNEVEGGFSIAIFCYALHLLPYNVQPIFKPFINDKGEMNGTYDQLLRHIEGQVLASLASVFTQTFDTIIRITSWLIWKHRNKKIFVNKALRTNAGVNYIKAISHLCIHSRSVAGILVAVAGLIDC